MENVNSFKLTLFKFKQSLDHEQFDISRILEKYMELCETNSEIEVYNGIRRDLSKFGYDPTVTQIFENLGTEISQYNLTYQLKDLYTKMARENYTGAYNKPLDVVMKIIMSPDESARYETIVNELKTYDWVPQIAGFVHNIMLNRQVGVSKHNHLTGGKASKVFTIAEACTDGTLAFIKDAWFLFTESECKPVRLGDYVIGESLETLLRLQQAVQSSVINESTISFDITDDINIGIGLDNENPGKLYINEELVSEHTELQHIFNMPAVPFIKRDFYPVILEAYNSLGKFIDLDVCTKVENPNYPHLETYAIHHADKAYVYRCDSRSVNQFYEYESIKELLEDVRKDSGFDMSYFYDSKLGKEEKQKIALEDQESVVEIELMENLNAIAIMESNSDLLMRSAELTEIYDTLQIRKIELEKELNSIKTGKITLRKSL